MARLDWDRLRRVRPLDGADARVDPDGGVVWERGEPADRVFPTGTVRLKDGVIVRRSGDIACPRCRERVERRKLLLHLRTNCPGRP